jgi:hypothetical protein
LASDELDPEFASKIAVISLDHDPDDAIRLITALAAREIKIVALASDRRRSGDALRAGADTFLEKDGGLPDLLPACISSLLED